MEFVRTDVVRNKGGSGISQQASGVGGGGKPLYIRDIRR